MFEVAQMQSFFPKIDMAHLPQKQNMHGSIYAADKIIGSIRQMLVCYVGDIISNGKLVRESDMHNVHFGVTKEGNLFIG